MFYLAFKITIEFLHILVLKPTFCTYFNPKKPVIMGGCLYFDWLRETFLASLIATTHGDG